jgi:hypothetical protein
MRARCHFGGDFGQVQIHCLDVALGKNEGGAEGLVPRFAQRRVILFFWPMRASSANHISIALASTFFSRAISSRRAGSFF